MTSCEYIVSELNSAQKVAATYKNENLLVLAGAGCGKTKTIIARTVYLISQGCTPSRIKILTFTKKAAYEITQRVNSYLDINCFGLGASTFHRWCIDLIKSTPEIFGFKDFTILDRDDQLQIFKVLRGKPQKGELPKASELCDTYSFARNTRQNLSKAIKQIIPVFEEKKEKIAKIMQEYEINKRKHNYLDYDDILDVVATAVTLNEDVCKWIAHKYDCILVDEMQDTNPLQWAILEPLSHYTKLFCVGDDAQSIYGFRGADFNNIHSFTERISDSVVLKLEDNYRSTQEILDISNWLLSKSAFNYDKKLKAKRGKGKIPELHTFLNNFEESRWIISDIKLKYEVDKLWNNKMILVRSGYSGRNVETELLRNKIPYVFIGGQKLMDAAHIKDVMSVLRIISNNKDNIAWIRFLTLFPGVGSITAEKFTERLIQKHGIEECWELLDTASYKGIKLSSLFQENYNSRKNLPEMIVKSLNYMNDLLENKYGKIEWEYRKKDFDFLKLLAEQFESIHDFIEEFLLNPIFISQKDQQEKENCVILSTIHSAKGNESDIVYVSGVSVGKYPALRDIEKKEDKEEERRVLYVALTRAKNELIVTRNLQQDFWLWESTIKQLEDEYFFKDLPVKLFKELIHTESTYVESFTPQYSQCIQKVEHSPIKSRLVFNSEKTNKQTDSCEKIETSNDNTDITDDLNPLIVDFMRTHQPGEVYPMAIKLAVVAEYVPNVYGYVKIGKKYGINSDVIKEWVKIYKK